MELKYDNPFHWVIWMIIRKLENFAVQLLLGGGEEFIIIQTETQGLSPSPVKSFSLETLSQTLMLENSFINNKQSQSTYVCKLSRNVCQNYQARYTENFSPMNFNFVKYPVIEE